MSVQPWGIEFLNSHIDQLGEIRPTNNHFEILSSFELGMG